MEKVKKEEWYIEGEVDGKSQLNNIYGQRLRLTQFKGMNVHGPKIKFNYD